MTIRLTLFATIIGATALAAETRATADDPKVILVIHTYGHDAPGRLAFDAAFARTLRETPGVATDLYIETLDPNRFRGEREQRLTGLYLREKYAGKKLAVVVAVYGLALDFLLDPNDPPFPGVPIAATLSRYPERVPPGVAFTWSGNALGGTVAMALKLHPGARQIAVIDGGPVRTAQDTLGREIRLQIESITPLPLIYLRDLPLDQLIERVRGLSSDTVLLHFRQLLGPGGAPIAQRDAIQAVSAAAPAPVYVPTDQMLGSGAAGGLVINMEAVGSQLATLVLRVAETGSSDVPPEEDRLLPMFDWRQLQRWNINEANLPVDSVILYRQVTLWDQYRFYAIAAIVVVGLQGALIGTLVVQRVRRRRTERALRQSHDRNQDLAGRLINAQEAERTRIARDLHDDVSQQLAGLAIMMSGLRHKAGKRGSEDEIQGALTALQDRTTRLAQSIRGLSHELHPSVLQHAGLVAALERHCADAGRTHAISVGFHADGTLDHLAPDVALCLFRVTQEALNNAVRHASAHAVRVQLASGGDGVELSVADDGIGFAPDERTGSGLGLRSIDERVRLVRGQLAIESRPGQGTVVRVRIPLTATGQDSRTRGVLAPRQRT